MFAFPAAEQYSNEEFNTFTLNFWIKFKGDPKQKTSTTTTPSQALLNLIGREQKMYSLQSSVDLWFKL